MTINIWFWILYVISVLLGLYLQWPSAPGPAGFRPIGGWVLIMILIGLLGWGIFGSAVKR